MMNPVLRLRRAFRAMGAEEEQAEEAASVIDAEYVGREYFDARLAQHEAVFARQSAELRAEMAELRQAMAEMRNQILVGVILIVALAVGALSIVIAVFS